ncbi:tRNA modification GTPase GTPBP3, mitochondrial isoform X1 [Anastrepha ludens]|uniref:tRNA modification GTPase GTPBP3, mitochondrial isoform X1 n=1 Tax=Anastrepha ludens TaxID=28586 RepID=UPI0023AED17D|nr:tRNA modification GTPase GTPBP3, mitochondrial isoform X1 [Anastrepha ludens]
MNCIHKITNTCRYFHRYASSISRNIADCTIYSLSSGHGKCGVSVIRVSGPRTKHALQAVVGSSYEPKARYAYLKSLYHPETKEIIDKGLVLWFPGPASFTGEDSCEFQVHGSLAVIAATLDALGKVPGLRPASAGEFTKRAFYGGKLDLTEVEGLADLIHAETEAQRKQAMLQSVGALSRVYDNWRRRLIRCAAHLEAYIDFAEEENIEDDVVIQLNKELRRIISEIRKHLNDQRQGEMLRNGVRTAIIGAPNVGKSSFLNMMCQREVAIVTSIAGTTRDIIESTHNFGGYPVVFADTAGLRKQTQDIVELEGINRAKECLLNADLILLLTDARELCANITTSNGTCDEYQSSYLQQLDLDASMLTGKRIKLIANKTDLLSTTELQKLMQVENVLHISCKQPTAIHMETFLKHFEEMLSELCGQPSAENPRITHTRYRQQLERCIEHLNIFLDEYAPDIFPDIAISAQKLRNALKCIERITGHVSSDDILDVVFKDFCIGK